MSQRHRSDAPPPPKVELRAHAHNERHRMHIELQHVATQVGAGLEPDEVHEPGRAWVPVHHHDSERAKAAAARQAKKHWKMKMWKRRSALRQAKAQAFTMAAKQA